MSCDVVFRVGSGCGALESGEEGGWGEEGWDEGGGSGGVIPMIVKSVISRIGRCDASNG